MLSPVGHAATSSFKKTVLDTDVDVSSTPQKSFRERFGEKVADLVGRLETIVLEVEGSTAPVLIVACESACRALRAYLLPGAASRLIADREIVDAAFHARPIGRGGPSHLIEFSSAVDGNTILTETLHEL